MSSSFGNGPKFPGDLSDRLKRPDEPADRWVDRIRHAWLLYAILAVIVPLWVGSMVAVVVFLGSFGWLLAMMILTIPLLVYARILQWRIISGRDPDTGERMGRRD
jgi:hypothetical protein